MLVPSSIPARRLTVLFADLNEYFGEDDQNITQAIASAVPIPVEINIQPNFSILKKNSKNAPFHVRGRRKSMISSKRPSESDFLENSSTANQPTATPSNALLSIANDYSIDSDED